MCVLSLMWIFAHGYSSLFLMCWICGGNNNNLKDNQQSTLRKCVLPFILGLKGGTEKGMGTKREPKYDILEIFQFRRVEASTSCCGTVGNFGVNLCKRDVHNYTVGGIPGLDPMIAV